MLLRLTLIVLVLQGCSDAPADVPRRSKEERRQDAIRLAQQPPSQTSHRLRSGELIVLDVPVVVAPGVADVQKCFVFRDAEYQSSSISCPSDATGVVSPGGPEPEKPYP